MEQEKRNNRMFLEDILLAMSRILEYTEGMDLIKFKQDYKTVDAVIRNFEIIGEASKSIDENIRNEHPGIPWKEMYYLRNRVSHEYFGIDYEIIWDVAINHIPSNKKEIEAILNKTS